MWVNMTLALDCKGNKIFHDWSIIGTVEVYGDNVHLSWSNILKKAINDYIFS